MRDEARADASVTVGVRAREFDGRGAKGSWYQRPMRRLVFVVVACATWLACKSGSPAAPAQPRPEPVVTAPEDHEASTETESRMGTFASAGFELRGAEYWPYRGTKDITYPDDVLWGFYPEAGKAEPGEEPNRASASPAAVACAEVAHKALRALLAEPPAKLRRIVELGGNEREGVVPLFYLWVNDYSAAATPYPPGVREARLWYWKRKEPAPPKPPGYWKWEATLAQDGKCHVPLPAQIESTLSEMLAKIESRAAGR